MTVFVPKDEAELQRLLATALSLDGPSVIRYPRSAGVGLPLESPIRPYAGPWVEELRQRRRCAVAWRPARWSRSPSRPPRLLAAQGVARYGGRQCRRVHPLDAEALLPLIERHRAS